jgi:hypothetical protein
MHIIINSVINFLSGISRLAFVMGTYYVFDEVGIQFVNTGL